MKQTSTVLGRRFASLFSHSGAIGARSVTVTSSNTSATAIVISGGSDTSGGGGRRVRTVTEGRSGDPSSAVV